MTALLNLAIIVAVGIWVAGIIATAHPKKHYLMNVFWPISVPLDWIRRRIGA